MKLFVAGLSYRTTPVEVRGRPVAGWGLRIWDKFDNRSAALISDRASTEPTTTTTKRAQ
jgi:hypothetical protein